MDGHSKSDCDTASAAGRCRDLVFSSDRYCELLLQTSGTTNRCTARRRGIRRFAVLLPEKETASGRAQLLPRGFNARSDV